MEPHESQFVPKVHPLDRAAESEDPLELLLQSAPGDPAVMLECVLQEFLWMGWDADQLEQLFHHPGYPVLCDLRQHFGDELVRQQIDALIARTGVPQFRATVVEDEDPDDEPQVDVVPLRMNFYDR